MPLGPLGPVGPIGRLVWFGFVRLWSCDVLLCF